MVRFVVDGDVDDVCVVNVGDFFEVSVGGDGVEIEWLIFIYELVWVE